jgi:hypothetical protein
MGLGMLFPMLAQLHLSRTATTVQGNGTFWGELSRPVQNDLLKNYAISIRPMEVLSHIKTTPENHATTMCDRSLSRFRRTNRIVEPSFTSVVAVSASWLRLTKDAEAEA